MATAKFDFSGKTALVTGAARGFGRAYALAFGAAKARVVVADVNRAGAEAVAAEIAASGGTALAVGVDVSDETQVATMAKAARDRFGGVDICVNNAARYAGLQRRRFPDIPVEEWRSYIDVNVTGSFLVARALVGDMARRRWGRIVNISSTTVPMGRDNILHYMTSKAAVIGMSRGMAREYGRDGITVNSVSPGLTQTEGTGDTSDQIWSLIVAKQCIPRREAAQDVVGAVLFLCTDEAAFITGQNILVDGGAAHS